MVIRSLRDIDLLVIIAAFSLLTILPTIYSNYFFVNSLFLATIYMISSTAWNIMGGYTGLISFGHAAFFGLGAYSLAITYNVGINPWIGIVIAGTISSLFALAISPPLLRLKSHWFALGTIAVGEALKLFFNNWEYVGGARGIELARREYTLQWVYFVEPIYYNYVAIAIASISIASMMILMRSRLGYYLQSIRESEETAMSVGIDPFKYKMIAMIASAFFTGVAGALYALRYRYVDPFSTMDLFISVQICLVAIVGGVYSFSGPIIGALTIVPIAEYIRAVIGGFYGARYFGIHLLIYGLVLLALSLYSPGGIISAIKKITGVRR
ncbi:MAG: branched-chain amino acid ABC transporter permease [Sulfolobales archaeon]